MQGVLRGARASSAAQRPFRQWRGRTPPPPPPPHTPRQAVLGNVRGVRVFRPPPPSSARYFPRAPLPGFGRWRRWPVVAPSVPVPSQLPVPFQRTSAGIRAGPDGKRQLQGKVFWRPPLSSNGLRAPGRGNPASRAVRAPAPSPQEAAAARSPMRSRIPLKDVPPPVAARSAIFQQLIPEPLLSLSPKCAGSRRGHRSGQDSAARRRGGAAPPSPRPPGTP